MLKCMRSSSRHRNGIVLTCITQIIVVGDKCIHENNNNKAQALSWTLSKKCISRFYRIFFFFVLLFCECGKKRSRVTRVLVY